MPLIPNYDVKERAWSYLWFKHKNKRCWGSNNFSFQAITGGKGTAYAEEIEKARKEALDDLKSEARKLGANGVLAIDFETAKILEGFILVTTYGTAVKLEKK